LGQHDCRGQGRVRGLRQQGKRHPHDDVVLTAPADRPAATNALRVRLILSFGLPFAAQKVFAGEDGDRRSRGVPAMPAVLAVADSLMF
jgi:hypothetical protein